MILTHTSPVEITNISTNGVFGSGLFFATDAVHFGKYIYTIDVDMDTILDASQILYCDNTEVLEDILADICIDNNVDMGTAQNLLDGTTTLHELDIFDIDNDFAIQKYQLQAAVLLGFAGVAIEDEHGTSYLIDMLGREQELTLQ